MATLLLAEVSGGQVNDATARALTAALELGAPVDVLVAGLNVGAAAEAVAKLQGVAKVLAADDALYAHGLAEPLAALIVKLAPGYDAIVAASTASAKNVAPRVAALLDVMQVSDIIKVIGAKTFERPIYAGNAIQTVEFDRSEDRRDGAHRVFRRDCPGRLGADRDRRGRSRSGCVVLRGRGARKVRSAGTDLGQDHHLGRPGDAEGGKLQDLYRASRRQARRGDGGFARRRRRGLRA